ncbi:hypothetical protein [Streptomyces sp. NPDC005828]
MTDAEFEEVRAEIHEYVRRTSFPALPDSDDESEFAPHEHAEYGESHH